MKLGKKLLSLLTVLCLTLSLFPTMALAADGEESTGSPATSVHVGSATLNLATPYLVKGETNGQSTITEQEKTAGYIYFDASNSTLTLNNYSSTTSHQICGNAGEDLIIKLNGDNRITSSGNGICSYGKLTISGPGSLTLTAAQNTTIYAQDTITIQGGAKVTAPCGQDGQSIHLNKNNEEIIITGEGTEVTASNGSNSKAGEIRCGASSYSSNTYTGTIQLNDGAKLTATTINGTLKVNGEANNTTTGTVIAPSTTSGYTVSGKVIDSNSQPIAGASIQLSCSTGTANANASAVISTSTTTESGTYSFSNVPAGKYTITASKEGYSASTGASVNVTVNNADVTTGTDLTLSLIKYNVYVNGTQVTWLNKDNVLNDSGQTVKYTPASEDGITPQKLTLNGAKIVNGTNRGIEASNDLMIDLIGENTINATSNAIYLYHKTTEATSPKLTITSNQSGTLSMTSSNTSTTVYAYSDITINGSAKVNATINGTAQAIHSPNGNIIIGGTAEVTATNEYSTTSTINSIAVLVGTDSSPSGTIEVKDSASLKAQGHGKALGCTAFTYPANGYVAKGSTDYEPTNPREYLSNNLATYKYVEVKPANTTSAGTSYGVWVGNTKVTSDNASNVLSDGQVSYDPATKTLTLKGATITGAANRAYTSAITDACGIYSTHALTINLVGRNTVSGATTSDYGNYGIFVSGKLTFTSDSNGSIIVSGGVSTNNGNAWVPGVYASGITVNNCNVTVSGGTAEGDKYPVSYAMSTAPTLVGVKATASRNRDGSDAETYSSSNNRNYKWIKIEQDATNTTIASPVIEPDSCYFTNNVTVTISCLTNGARIYYSTDGTNFSEYRNAIPINDTTTITAYATKDDKTSATITATFTKRDASATPVTSVILDKSELDLKTNQNENLVATVTPANASDATVVWTSNDPSVATIDARGNVTTVGIGKARITATTKDGGYIAFCDVIVTEREPVQITFSDESGTVSPANTNAYGKLSTLPTPTRSGYSFDGWYTEAEGGTAVTTDTVFDKATTIYAHWTRNSSSGSHTTYYPVNTPAKSEGGSVVVSQKSASRGTTVTVTATAASGYQVAQVSAVDKDGKTVSLTDKGDGVYTFVMPASKVDVTARFAQVQKPEEKDPYGDVSKDSYYYDAVKWAAETGVTTGVGDGLFAPEWVCTRGQIVTFLWRASGSPAPKATELPFTDVAADAYYAQAVLWAVENGITNGTSETTFSPDQTCTRAHAVAFLYRMSGSPAAAGSTFSDVAADAYYSTAVAWAVEKDITNGTSGTTFSPDDTCTRGQIVTFLYRLAQTK